MNRCKIPLTTFTSHRWSTLTRSPVDSFNTLSAGSYKLHQKRAAISKNLSNRGSAVVIFA
jgi:hypothetical protein